MILDLGLPFNPIVFLLNVQTAFSLFCVDWGSANLYDFSQFRVDVWSVNYSNV